MQTNESLKRIFNYSVKSHIKMSQTPWLGHFFIKGFSPHLRTVHLLKNNPKNDRFWMAHDILHIFFYDYAFLRSKKNKNLFKDQNRFYEVHLASEAFAVLALDYFILSEKKNQTITIDFFKKDWESFSKLNPRLPYFKSNNFIKLLLDAYFTGHFNQFLIKSKNEKYNKWIDHEISYSKKQRAYVTQWWNDLNQKKSKPKEVIVENSFIFELVIEALGILFSSKSTWQLYLNNISKTKWPKNYFKCFKKFKSNNKVYDFRFTDLRSINPKLTKTLLSNAKSPSAGILFLIWQILAQFEPEQFTNDEKLIIEELYDQSQKSKPDQKTWQQAVIIAQKYFYKLKPYKLNTEFKANFFLQ